MHVSDDERWEAAKRLRDNARKDAARPGIYVVAYEMPVNAKEMTR